MTLVWVGPRQNCQQTSERLKDLRLHQYTIRLRFHDEKTQEEEALELCIRGPNPRPKPDQNTE